MLPHQPPHPVGGRPDALVPEPRPDLAVAVDGDSANTQRTWPTKSSSLAAPVGPRFLGAGCSSGGTASRALS